MCSFSGQSRKGVKSPCGWYSVTEYVVLEKWAASKTPQFIYQVRPEQAREILIFPRPPLHWTNKEMVSFEPFWRACKLFFDHLSTVTHSTNPVETFAFNFARWETRLSIDPVCGRLPWTLSRNCQATSGGRLAGRRRRRPDGAGSLVSSERRANGLSRKQCG